MSTSPTAARNTDRKEVQGFEASEIRASLTVKNLQASLDWYQDVVGFVVTERHEREGVLRAISLRGGSVEILIGQDDGAKGTDRVKGQGFSLYLTTSQNVDELAARIKAHGGVLEMEPTDLPWGVRAFRLQDPDGYKFAISSERKR